MSGSEHHDGGPGAAGLSRSLPFVAVAVVLVVVVAWVSSLFWGGSTSAAPQAGGTTSPTPSVTPTVTVSVAISPTATVSVTATVTATVKEPVQVAPMGVLGPTGVGKVQLGMSYKDALATGQVVKGTNPRISMAWTLKNHPRAGLCMSKANGVMAIFADKSAVSPEGIYLGSTMAQVKAAYPNLTATPNGWVVPLTATTSYLFLFTSQRGAARASEWLLQSSNETCFN